MTTQLLEFETSPVQTVIVNVADIVRIVWDRWNAQFDVWLRNGDRYSVSSDQWDLMRMRLREAGVLLG
jgi:hypothetical protein